MGYLARLLFWLALPATVIGVPTAFAWLALERQPVVARMPGLSAQDVRQAQALLKRYDRSRVAVGQPTTVVATERQLNTAVHAGLSSLGRVKGRVAVDDPGVKVVATAELPVPLRAIPRFINVRAVIAPSPTGLNISQVSVGRLNVPPRLALPILESVIDIAAGPGKGAAFVGAVRAVSVQGKSVSVAFKPPNGMISDVKTVAKVSKKVETKAETAVETSPEKQVETKPKRAGDPDAAAVRAYYTKLIELARRQGSNAPTSLTAFVQPMFRLARERSKAGNPIGENKAAILALSLYFGDRHMEGLVGDLLSADMRRKRRHIEHVRLDGRHDFVQHFVVSAGLTLIGGAAMADAAGVVKEVGDSGGASGFSFTDLAADRAGVRFARAAIASHGEAVRFQHRLSDLITEADIFPPVRDLPEGLSGSEFKRRYGDTRSRAYNRLVAEIDRRLGKITLYQ